MNMLQNLCKTAELHFILGIRQGHRHLLLGLFPIEAEVAVGSPI